MNKINRGLPLVQDFTMNAKHSARRTMATIIPATIDEMIVKFTELGVA